MILNHTGVYFTGTDDMHAAQVEAALNRLILARLMIDSQYTVAIDQIDIAIDEFIVLFGEKP